MPLRSRRRFRRSRKTPSSVKRYVNSTINRKLETKYAFGYHTNEITSTATFVSLVSTAQGDDITERIGDEIDPRHLQIRGIVTPNSSGTAQFCRLIVFQWKPNRNDVAPTAATQIIYDGTNQPLHSPIRKYNPQFRLIADKKLHVPAVTSLEKSGTFYTITASAKKLSKIKWSTAASTQDTNHLYMMILGENATGVTACQINQYEQLLFKDG